MSNVHKSPSDTFGGHKIPFAVKVAYTGFLCVVVPYNLWAYGPLNFLWFCDVALAVSFVAIWTESALLVSMPAVGIVLPQMLWIIDFALGLFVGVTPIGFATYMFDSKLPLLGRGISLFHGWLPLFLLWLVWRLGYDRRALLAQSALAAGVLLLCFLLVSSPDGPAGNVNKVFGPDDANPQTWMPPVAWLGVLMLAYPICFCVPSHFLFRALFRTATFDPANASG